MFKEVFVQVDERNKCVKFKSVPGVDDAKSLREALEEASKSDADLRSRLHMKVLIFQTKKTTKNGRTIICDINESEPIEDECELVATFCSQPPVPISNLTNNIMTNNSFEESSGCIVSVIPTDEEINCQYENFDVDFVASTEYDLPCDMIDENGNKLKPDTASFVSTGANKKMKTGRGTRKLQKLPLDVPWKEVGEDILKLRPSYDIFHQKIVQFYSEFLCAQVGLNRVNGEHYNALGAKLCQRFPELADDNITRPQASICSSISQYVRNKRRRDKLVLARCGIVSDSPSQSSQKAGPAVEIFTETSESYPNMTVIEESRLENMSEELASKVDMGCTTHIKFLFKATHEYRRQWIAKELPSGFRVRALTTKWPHLEKSEMILLEQSLLVGKDQASLEQSLSKCLLEVAEFHELQLGPDSSHKEQVECLRLVYAKHKPRNSPRGLPPCITVLEVKTKIASELNSIEGEGARCVMYLDGETLATCFVVADGNIKLKLSNPNPMLALALVLGCYRAWDKFFPMGYKSFLNIFEEFGVGLQVTDTNENFKKFKKLFKIWREKKSAA